MFNFWGMWVVVTGYGMAGGGWWGGGRQGLKQYNKNMRIKKLSKSLKSLKSKTSKLQLSICWMFVSVDFVNRTTLDYPC